MAKNDNLKDFLTDVADAIRTKKGTTDKINPQDFASEIASIETSQEVVEAPFNDVNFRDYDGTILYSYSKDEFLALTELPPLPTKKGLICQEWNWTYEEAMAYVGEYGILEVGATYITDDGATRLYISINNKERMNITLSFTQTRSNGVQIDWGDGSPLDSIDSPDNANTGVEAYHTYAQTGDYVIKMNVVDGIARLAHGKGHFSLFGDMRLTGTTVMANMLRKLEVGSGIDTIQYTCLANSMMLELISIPNNVRGGDTGSFSPTALKCIVIPRSMTNHRSFAYNNKNIFAYIIPPTTTTFTGQCNGLEQVQQIIIPDGTSTMPQQCFRTNKSLTRMIIPKSITGISALTFDACTSMRYYDFTHHEQVPTLENINAFTGIPTDCEIRVPKALEEEWKQATNWSEYASQIVGV